jgi:protocatechuate 3,4-dioxygenase beta subunit
MINMINLKLVLLLLVSIPACAQNNTPALQQLDADLQSKSKTVNEVLADNAYMYLHSQTAFRELIKKYAPAGKAIMITPAEPGKKISVKCKVTGSTGLPVAGALLYAYQTSAKGWYSDTAAHILMNEGDMRHARLFGYAYTDKKGEFELVTIQPAGYPQSDLPAHIHIAMWKNNQYIQGVPGELLFDDDERLTPERREKAISGGFLIAKDSGVAGSPVYRYQFSVKQ